MAARIVIIDTDALFCEQLGELCTQLGFDVETYTDGPKGFQVAVGNPPALAILGALEGGAGFEICSKLIRAHGELPVLMVITAEARKSKLYRRHKKRKTAASAYLLRPVTMRALYRACSEYVEIPISNPPDELLDMSLDGGMGSLELDGADIDGLFGDGANNLGTEIDSALDNFFDADIFEMEEAEVPSTPLISTDDNIRTIVLDDDDFDDVVIAEETIEREARPPRKGPPPLVPSLPSNESGGAETAGLETALATARRTIAERDERLQILQTELDAARGESARTAKTLEENQVRAEKFDELRSALKAAQALAAEQQTAHETAQTSSSDARANEVADIADEHRRFLDARIAAHETEMETLQANHAQAIEALDERLTAAASERDAAHAEIVEGMRAAHKEALDAQAKSHKEAHDKRAGEHLAEMLELQSDMTDSLDQRVQELAEEHASKTGTALDDHTEKLKKLESSQAETAADANAAHEATLSALRTEHAEAVEAMTAQHSVAEAALQTTLETTRQGHESILAALREEHTQALDAANSLQDATVQEATEAIREELEALRREWATSLTDQVADAREAIDKEHARQLAGLKDEHAEKIGALTRESGKAFEALEKRYQKREAKRETESMEQLEVQKSELNSTFEERVAERTESLQKELGQRIETLETRLGLKSEESDERETARSDAEGKIAELESALAEARTLTDTAEQSRDEAREHKESSQAELAKTNTELSALQKELGLTREKLETTLSELDKHSAAAKELENRLQAARHERADEVEDRDARLLDLSEQLEALRNRISELESGIEGLNEELAQRESELRGRDGEFDEIRKARDAHAARADALEADDQNRAALMDKARTALSLAQTFFAQLTETTAVQQGETIAEVDEAPTSSEGTDAEAEDASS